MDASTRQLDKRILSFIRRFAAGAPESAFNALSLQIFAHQYARNAVYRRWCQSAGKNPADVRTWKEIPAVPAAAFKSTRLAAFPKAQTRRVFKTSGTTSAGRGKHGFDTLRLYEASIVEPFRRAFLKDRARLAYFYLMPAPAQAPDSSLSHMMGVVNRVFARGRGKFYVRNGIPDYRRLLADLSNEKQKVFLLSTAFALKGLLDELACSGRRLRLPAGSRLLETGGFKGRYAEISKAELYGLCEKYLGISRKRMVSEYGMTELSSQYYDGLAPGWLRTVVVDPRTGREARRGAVGLLRHVDLANRGSVMAIETEDVGCFRGGRLVLLGRVSGAGPRGCSLAFEEFLKK